MESKQKRKEKNIVEETVWVITQVCKESKLWTHPNLWWSHMVFHKINERYLLVFVRSSFRKCLLMNFHSAMKLVQGLNHPCLWWNGCCCFHVFAEMNFIRGWTHPCQKGRGKNSSQNEKKKLRHVNTWSRG